MTQSSQIYLLNTLRYYAEHNIYCSVGLEVDRFQYEVDPFLGSTSCLVWSSLNAPNGIKNRCESVAKSNADYATSVWNVFDVALALPNSRLLSYYHQRWFSAYVDRATQFGLISLTTIYGCNYRPLIVSIVWPCILCFIRKISSRSMTHRSNVKQTYYDSQQA